MAELTAEIAPEVISACQAGAEEAAGSFGRVLDGEFELAVGEVATYTAAKPPEAFVGAALAILLRFGESGAVVVLPESTGILPEWCVDPDASGSSRLATLAQELSLLLVPDSLESDSFQAGWVEDTSAALTRAKVADPATLVPLSLKRGDHASQLGLIWPLASPDGLLPGETDGAKTKASDPSEPTDLGDFSCLPKYSRSLLKIQVPVSVNLACKKESLHNIVELVPGSIIQFDKSCDEFLQLAVGDQSIADGDAVKVGDKFGLRIHKMVMPPEHFGLVVAKTVDGAG